MDKPKEKYIDGVLYKLCACGICGKYFPAHKTTGGSEARFIKGHQSVGRKYSKETREKISKGKKGTPAWNKGKTGIYSEETIQKIKEARKRQKIKSGWHHSDESKEKNRIAHLGKRLNIEPKEPKQKRVKMTDEEKREKKQVAARLYYQTNKDKIKIKQAEYYQEHKEDFRRKQKRWLGENKEKRQEYERLYREKNKERENARIKVWYANNKEKHMQTTKEWRLKNPEKVFATTEAWRKNNPGHWRKYQEANLDKHRDGEQRRRARKNGRECHDISNMNIYQRDGWICQICNATVDQELKWPDPYSPSLDHIIPIAKGGNHVEDNVQLAHLQCNMRKSANINFTL